MPHLSGLLTRSLPNGKAHRYNNTQLTAAPVLLGDSYNIRLHNVTCADSGRYTCHLAASVGDQNREGEILLMLAGEETLSHLMHLLMYVNVNIPLFSDCPETPAETAVDDVFMAMFATFVLVFALVVFRISYVSDQSQNQSSFSLNVHLIHASPILCLSLRFV